MPEAKLTDLAVGDVLNNTYRLEHQIGEGGMGRVFAATDLKLERRVAVKALHAANLDTETVRRFDRETQVMGQLDHPSVVTLFSFGRTRGVPWLAMRLLDGHDLWETLAQHGGRMPPQALLPIVRQILGALSYLHGRGLLHRDLKPSNIHVGKTGKVTLCDFGLARGHHSSLTRTGVIWGTPEYMAPEQILGERELDGRTDLYSLAVVMFRMLAGRPLFDDENDQDVLRAHLNRPRPDLARLVPSLSPMVGAAMQKGLAVHPEDRFQSAEEMLQAMELVLAMPPVTPRGASVPTVVAGPAKRAEGTKPVPKAAVHEVLVVTTPSLPAVTDRDEPATRPHGFTALDEAEGVSTARDGFTPVSVTPLEGDKVTQQVEAVSDLAPAWTERTQASAPAVRAGDSVEHPPVQRDGGRQAPRPGKPFLPMPVLIGGAVALFLLGLVVAKLLL